jgi:hypothetical protein
MSDSVAILLNKKTPGKIGILELDATVHESHEYINTLTEFPVEKGFNISDHVIRAPEKLTIEGFITNTPIPRSSDLQPLNGSAAQINRVESALEILLDLAGLPSPAKNTSDVSSSALFPKVIDEVQTGLRAYKNMVITRLTIPRDKDTGETMRFTCEMRHLITVLTETVTMQNTSELNGRAPNTSTQATNEAKKGNQNGKTPTDEKSSSILADVNNWLTKFTEVKK